MPANEIATIGDQPNDVLMFKRSGFSIAMGNASDEVKAQAAAVTASYNDEGFAKAMEAFILVRGEIEQMAKAIGRIEILRDPPALAHHVAEWMTQAALAAQGPFRVSLSGGSTPKTLYALLASDEFSNRVSLAARVLVLGRRALRPLRSSRTAIIG